MGWMIGAISVLLVTNALTVWRWKLTHARYLRLDGWILTDKRERAEREEQIRTLDEVKHEQWKLEVRINELRGTVRKQEAELSVLRDLAAEAALHREAAYMPGDGWAENRDGARLDTAVHQWLDLCEPRSCFDD
jgi:hypothetical protein